MQLARTLFVSLVAACVAVAAFGLEAHSLKVYRGGNGVKVALLRLKPLADKRGLLRVSGTDTDLDDVVVATEIEVLDVGQDHYATWQGAKVILLSMRDETVSLHVPGKRAASRLVYDEKLSESAKAEDLLKAATPEAPPAPNAPPPKPAP